MKSENCEKLRALVCDVDPLYQTDGSVLFAQGATVVLAATQGPIENKSQLSFYDAAFVDCYFRSKQNQQQSVKDRITESCIRDVCELAFLRELNPLAKLVVAVQELDDRGSIESCAINGACMAMLLAGAPMKFAFAAVNCIIDKEQKFIVDPDEFEMVDAQASFLCVYQSQNGSILRCDAKGIFTREQLHQAERLCFEASQEIITFFKQTNRNKFKPVSNYEVKTEVKEDTSMET